MSEKHNNSPAPQSAQDGEAVAYILRDGDGAEFVRLAKHVDPKKLIAVNVQPLYSTATVEALRAELDTLRRQIDGFPNLDAMRQAMIDAADESIVLKREAELYRHMQDVVKASGFDGITEAVTALAASQQRVRELEGAMYAEITGPVTIAKAIRAGKKAHVVLDGGVGPKAAVHIENIGLTGRTHTAETADAFATGYNKGVYHCCAALAGAAPVQAASAERVAVLELCAGALKSLLAVSFQIGPKSGEKLTAAYAAVKTLDRVELRERAAIAKQEKGE